MVLNIFENFHFSIKNRDFSTSAAGHCAGWLGSVALRKSQEKIKFAREALRGSV